MRILHLIHQYLPKYVGGTELYTQAVARGQVQRGHQVSIFYRAGGVNAGLERRVENGVTIYGAWSGPLTTNRRFMATFGDATLERAFGRALDNARPDVLHVEHLMGLPVALVHAAQRRHIPFVITLHDYWWVCANAQLLTNYSRRVCRGPQAFVNCARCALARSGHPHFFLGAPPLAVALGERNALLEGVLKHAAGIVAPTEFVRAWYAGHGAPADRLSVISHGLEGASVAKKATPRDDGVVRFVYIGGLTWQKGIHVLVEAFSRVRSRAGCAPELWLAGDETGEPELVARLKAKAVPNVRWLGRLDRPDVWATLALADVVVVPTLWYETFSLIVSEAFAAGLPVIASRIGPLADRIQTGVNGMLVPPGNLLAWREAMQRVVDDPAYLAELRQHIEPPMTLDAHLDALDALYQQVIY
jgi:glycosyltransferase involved in cell wall biosynthesis